MPIDGEYEPSTAAWVRNQVEEYESSGGTRGTTLADSGLPVVIITAFAIVAMIAGTLAAVLPARRASRLNVLQALQYE